MDLWGISLRADNHSAEITKDTSYLSRTPIGLAGVSEVIGERKKKKREEEDSHEPRNSHDETPIRDHLSEHRCEGVKDEATRMRKSPHRWQGGKKWERRAH